MIRVIVAAILMSVAANPSPAEGNATGESCRPAPPSLAQVLEISDRVILAKVTRITRDPAHSPRSGEPRMERGVFELTPVQTLKGAPVSHPLVHRYDATLYPDLFGGLPCRWSAQPVVGEVWLIAASRDGQDCAECDDRLDATHRLYHLAPEADFRR